jgi:hypothetical protein
METPIFNRLQIVHFLAEWATRFNRASTPEENALLSAIRDLAEKSMRDVHLYLVFIGD